MKLLAFGLAAAVLALVLGLAPLSSQGQPCGSVFAPENVYFGPRTCDDVRSLVRIPAVVFIIGAVVGIIGGGIAVADKRMRNRSDQ